MSGALSRLNPAERRFAMGVGLFLFVILNYFFVWPHFSDWSILKRRLEKARDQRGKYEALIRQSTTLKPELDKLKGEGGDVVLEDQSLQFVRAIQNQANLTGLRVDTYGRQTSSTNNAFFIEVAQTISTQCAEKPLVDFLYNLGTDGSMIRVRSLNLHPDPQHQQLAGNITLVASYQKKPKTQPASSTATKPAAAQPAAGQPAAGQPAGSPAQGGKSGPKAPTLPAPRTPAPKAPTPTKK